MDTTHSPLSSRSSSVTWTPRGKGRNAELRGNCRFCRPHANPSIGGYFEGRLRRRRRARNRCDDIAPDTGANVECAHLQLVAARRIILRLLLVDGGQRFVERWVVGVRVGIERVLVIKRAAGVLHR